MIPWASVSSFVARCQACSSARLRSATRRRIAAAVLPWVPGGITMVSGSVGLRRHSRVVPAGAPWTSQRAKVPLHTPLSIARTASTTVATSRKNPAVDRRGTKGGCERCGDAEVSALRGP
nr:hypothetical protein [Deltaproteobacteria bacterium]